MIDEPLEALVTLLRERMPLMLMVMARLLSALSVLPVLGSITFPIMARAGLGLFLAAFMVPLLPPVPVDVPRGTPDLFLMVIGEMVVGLVIGWTCGLAVQMLETAGGLIDASSGLAMIEMVDPETDMPTHVFGQLLATGATMAFLAGGGHLMLVEILAFSFRIIPPGGPLAMTGDAFSIVASAVSGAILTGIRLAGPVILGLLLNVLVLAALARVMPQLNIWILSMPLQVGGAIILTALGLPHVLRVYAAFEKEMLETSLALARALGA